MHPFAGLISEVEGNFSGKRCSYSRSSNFEYRPQQQQMAMAVARSTAKQRASLVEAGTGWVKVSGI
jgi:hypothetical protein